MGRYGIGGVLAVTFKIPYSQPHMAAKHYRFGK
jgi:hypothetical protein